MTDGDVIKTALVQLLSALPEGQRLSTHVVSTDLARITELPHSRVLGYLRKFWDTSLAPFNTKGEPEERRMYGKTLAMRPRLWHAPAAGTVLYGEYTMTDRSRKRLLDYIAALEFYAASIREELLKAEEP